MSSVSANVLLASAVKNADQVHTVSCKRYGGYRFRAARQLDKQAQHGAALRTAEGLQRPGLCSQDCIKQQQAARVMDSSFWAVTCRGVDDGDHLDVWAGHHRLRSNRCWPQSDRVPSDGGLHYEIWEYC